MRTKPQLASTCAATSNQQTPGRRCANRAQRGIYGSLPEPEPCQIRITPAPSLLHVAMDGSRGVHRLRSDRQRKSAAGKLKALVKKKSMEVMIAAHRACSAGAAGELTSCVQQVYHNMLSKCPTKQPHCRRTFDAITQHSRWWSS